MGGFNKDHLINIEDVSVSKLKKEHLENLDPDAAEGLSGGHIKNLDPDAVKGFNRKHMKRISQEALSDINVEQVKNLNQGSKDGLKDSVSSFESFDISVKKELVDDSVRLLGGVGSFADVLKKREQSNSIDSAQGLDAGWNSEALDRVKNASIDKGSTDSDSPKIRGVFGGDTSKTNVLEKGATSRIKAKFGKLKIFKAGN
tara:strand:- start:239 stop:841 length:603 start_codon:yes stop_codon:yes gene_type:complete